MRLTILAGAALLLPMAMWAADIFDIKPGLWEYTTTTSMDMAGGQQMPAMPQLTEEQLAKIPPAQRAQIEAMMKNRGAMGSPRTNTSKVCITKESLAKALNFSQQQNTCTSKVNSLSSTKQEIHIDCAGQFKGSGDFIIERVDSEHAKGNMTMKTEGGHAMTMKMTMSTKFLSSDCGDVKPAGEK